MNENKEKAPISLKSKILAGLGIVMMTVLAVLVVNANYQKDVAKAPSSTDSLLTTLVFNHEHMYLIEDSLVEIPDGCKEDTITVKGYPHTIDIDIKNQKIGIVYDVIGQPNKYQIQVTDGQVDATLTFVKNAKGENCLVVFHPPYVIILSQSEACTNFEDLPQSLPAN